VGIGDRLRVRYPVATGPRTYSLSSRSLPITGIHTSPLRFVAYANAPVATTLRLAGLVNRISVAPAHGHNGADVKRALLALPAVTAVQGAAAMTDAVDQTMSQFTDVLIVTVAIAIIMALLIAYNAAAINAEERTRETATMFAYGIRPASVIRGNVIEALLIGTLATLAGVAAGYAILRWITGVSMRSTMPDLGILISISPVTVGLAALAGFVSVSLAPVMTLRRLERTDVPSALRVVE
jgi:putative ABC transport system permease protein